MMNISDPFILTWFIYYGNVIEVIIYDECKFMYLWKILNDENIDVMYVWCEIRYKMDNWIKLYLGFFTSLVVRPYTYNLIWKKK